MTTRVRTSLASQCAVVLVGPAGIGKSTALARCLRGVDHVIGRCLSAFTPMAFRPLSHAFGHPFTGSPSDVATDIAAALGDRTLVVEDVHWADASTLAVLRELAGRAPLLVTSRSAEPLGRHDAVDEITIAPLDERAAMMLAGRFHPALTHPEREALVTASGGNPLLLRHLAHDGTISPGFTSAIADRVSRLSDEVLDGLGRLALVGAPATRDLVSLESGLDGGLTVDLDDGRIWFTHDLVAVAVPDALGPERLERLRRELVVRLPPAEACRHHLALGDHSAAADAARHAARDADPTQRADLLALALDALGADAPAELALEAAAAAIDAHRPAEARRIASAVVGDDRLTAEAWLQLGRADWLDGNTASAAEHVDRALALVAGTASALEALLVVERAFIAVRRRVGDPAIVPLADDAVETATRLGVPRARALNTAALARSHVGREGWRELLDEAHAAAVAEGDEEEQLASRYWLLSSLGFYGPMQEAIAAGAATVDTTARMRARRWHHHFLGAHIVHLSARGEVPAGRVDEAHRLLREAPRFRNRAQVELALVSIHADRGDLDRCDEIVTAGLAAARSGEDVALLACARCEIALARRDLAGMRAALDTIGTSGVSFFGLNALAESAAINLAFGHPGEIDPPSTVTTLTPLLDVVRLEREAHDRQLAGDVEGAIRLCRRAADEWHARGFLRFARRARLGQVEIAAASNDLERAAQLLATIARAPADVSSRRLEALERDVTRRRARSRLTGRELQVLALVGEGLTSRQIGERLGIGAATVDSHIDAAMRRLGARTRVQAASVVGG